MARTSNVFARVEPEIKDQAEVILDQLGIPMSNAIGMFLRQVIIHNGIPFEMKLPVKKPLVMSELSKDDFDKEISKGINDIESGNVYSEEEVFEDIQRKYGI
ncbi:MAG: type II toxin-antitoxin system RelB/DinJ family antitoxin [Oscillospiraceae bacterium]|nr:type II toxin-antitoxin system RelB/DinJ family antitoxin [Oscillospiraceae bacterium]